MEGEAGEKIFLPFSSAVVFLIDAGKVFSVQCCHNHTCIQSSKYWQAMVLFASTTFETTPIVAEKIVDIVTSGC